MTRKLKGAHPAKLIRLGASIRSEVAFRGKLGRRRRENGGCFLRYGYSDSSKSPLETSSPGASMNPSLSANYFHDSLLAAPAERLGRKRYWRFNYRFNGTQKTLALRVFQEEGRRQGL